MSIQAIDQGSVHRITSGQVVIDLQTAVKELVENGLDAGASSIVVIFREYGVEAIEVQDNGKGIDEADWPGIALKHHTSKLTNFADLTSVATLGFRGEALSSLSGVASLALTTATAATAPMGTTLTFSASGATQVGAKVARQRGMSVTVKELFRNLPVRRKELEKNRKREFGKCLDLLQAYAIISTNTRFEVKNVLKGKTQIHLQTPAADSVRANFSSIFTPKATQSMMDLNLRLNVLPDKSVMKYSEEGTAKSTQVCVNGIISKPIFGQGRTTNNRSFYFINSRPFSPAKISKAFNEIYKNFNSNSFPAVVANFELPADAYDVNVSPDKRTIFLHSEGNLIAALKTALEQLFEPSRSIFPMTQISSPKKFDKIESSAAQSVLNTHHAQSDDTPRTLPSPSPSPSPSSKRDANLIEDEEIFDFRPKKIQRIEEPVAADYNDESIQVEMTKLDEHDTREDSPPRLDFDLSTPNEDDRVEFSPLADPNSPSIDPPPAPKPILKQMTLNNTIADATNSAPKAKKILGEPRLKFDLTRFLKRAENSNGTENAADTEKEEEANGHKGTVSDQIDSPPNSLGQQESAKSPSYASAVESDFEQTRAESEEILIEPISASTARWSEPSDQFAENDEVIVDTTTPFDDVTAATQEEVWGIEPNSQIILECDFEKIAQKWKTRPREANPAAATNNVNTPNDTQSDEFVQAGVETDFAQAEQTLSRIVSKQDFSAMSVIGQFNHAFIIARRAVKHENVMHDDLFIIDQHASDEKFNFEDLQANSQIQSQKLIQPRTLSLPSHDEIIAIEHVEILRLNGFEIEIDENCEIGGRVKLVAQPMTGKVSFGPQDFEELLDLLKSATGGEIARPSKVRKLFASRACRKSVMFGKPLTRNQMTTIVRHMGTMEQPWSCPHGRPTLRWLAGLNVQPEPDLRENIAALRSLYAQTSADS